MTFWHGFLPPDEQIQEDDIQVKCIDVRSQCTTVLEQIEADLQRDRAAQGGRRTPLGIPVFPVEDEAEALDESDHDGGSEVSHPVAHQTVESDIGSETQLVTSEIRMLEPTTPPPGSPERSLVAEPEANDTEPLPPPPSTNVPRLTDQGGVMPSDGGTPTLVATPRVSPAEDRQHIERKRKRPGDQGRDGGSSDRGGDGTNKHMRTGDLPPGGGHVSAFSALTHRGGHRDQTQKQPHRISTPSPVSHNPIVHVLQLIMSLLLLSLQS